MGKYYSIHVILPGIWPSTGTRTVFFPAARLKSRVPYLGYKVGVPRIWLVARIHLEPPNRRCSLNFNSSSLRRYYSLKTSRFNHESLLNSYSNEPWEIGDHGHLLSQRPAQVVGGPLAGLPRRVARRLARGPRGFRSFILQPHSLLPTPIRSQ